MAKASKVQTAVDTGDKLVGEGLAMASNKVAPVAGPILVRILWDNKIKIILAIISILCFGVFALEALLLTSSANSTARSLIPDDHYKCIQEASLDSGVDFALLASYGKVIADFDQENTGDGVGFLEIPDSIWQEYKKDGDGNGEIKSEDLCDNYATLVSKLGSISGSVEDQINNYPYSKKSEIERWYKIFSGATETPYGNPIGLDRKELATITSPYNKVRVIFGRRHVHKGMDIVPSGTWYAENPGKGSTDAINYAIMSGEVRLFKDRFGALCSYIENESYKLLYCHCDSFIAENNTQVKYGDPICYMGSTGFSTAPHTHIGLYQKNGNGWQMVDPTPFMFPN